MSSTPNSSTTAAVAAVADSPAEATAGPRLAILPRPDDNLAAAATAAGGTVEALSEMTTGIILSQRIDAAELSALLDSHPGIGWVQLPSAGVELYAPAFEDHPNLQWTSAKGSFARPVAEHALALTLALLRRFPESLRATSWGEERGSSLFGLRVVIVGAGGIAQEIIRLFKVFDTFITVLRRGKEPLPGADQTISMQSLHGSSGQAEPQTGAEPGRTLADVLANADVVVLAAALTAETKGLVGAPEMARMKPDCIVVNIARGALVDTDALLAALASGALAGAGLDVTDPEPLPDGHPLWSEPNAIITPHTADTEEMVRPLIAARVHENVRRWGAHEPLQGRVDAGAGY
ncbi:hydroxyacid dehydrogenase [Paeniglutamicibacter antarcticus]|uniref:Hydroxyacid dehydrogenase n=2 Tax=Arthrobacter terrae TaxID=2935737 RepID=A0A931CK58_9MICC|nr:hydroxyacid dehydrogenase [Arthrobacter terrae]